MSKNIVCHLFVFVLVLITALASPTNSLAKESPAPEWAGSAFDLIIAVNGLRASNGLPAYRINSTLMDTAQNQADFMAATGTVTHSGPGGIGLTDRLLAAGYPLAGDLSLGGFRAENIVDGSESLSAQSAVDQWTGDAPHWNTMLSQNLTEIGAGVSIAGGRVYYVIDAALPTTGAAPQAVTPIVEGGSSIPAEPPTGVINEVPVPVVVIMTPDQNGEVIHEVLAGQTLWQIAISYDVKIDDIKRLNNLSDDNIYAGEKLLIVIASSVTEAPTALATSTTSLETSVVFTLVPTMVSINAAMVPTVPPETQPNSSTVRMIMFGIIALALLAGGLFTRFGNANRE